MSHLRAPARRPPACCARTLATSMQYEGVSLAGAEKAAVLQAAVEFIERIRAGGRPRTTGVDTATSNTGLHLCPPPVPMLLPPTCEPVSQSMPFEPHVVSGRYSVAPLVSARSSTGSSVQVMSPSGSAAMEAATPPATALSLTPSCAPDHESGLLASEWEALLMHAPSPQVVIHSNGRILKVRAQCAARTRAPVARLLPKHTARDKLLQRPSP
ncbi:MAG: hypothetical protein EOO41_02175 [Methanobacteriota archaeon]|nr:MAG: hypothetical protein EOO41_02175 [Euryarchaeota archaeon]